MQPRLSIKGAAPRAAAAAGPGDFRKTDSGAAAGNDVHRKLLAGFHPRGVGSDQIKLDGGRLEHRRNCSFQIEARSLLVFEVHATEFGGEAFLHRRLAAAGAGDGGDDDVAVASGLLRRPRVRQWLALLVRERHGLGE